MLATSTVTIQVTDESRPIGHECRLPDYLKPLPPYLHKQALNLQARLHTCLDISQLLDHFCQAIDMNLPGLMVTVDCPDCYMPVPLKPGQRQWQFHIIINHEYLCELNLYSDRALQGHEVELLEQWMRVLAYPLRNALHLHKMRMQVFRDGLTGVQNRLALDQALDREIASAQRHQTELSLLVIDIDHFKSINDRYGHSCGDMALQTTAGIVRDSLRNSDQIFRYGGEEFVILLTHTEFNGTQVLAERIRLALAEEEHLVGDIRIPITVSIGVATLQWDDTAKSLFDRADQALYQAKHNGRNQTCCLDKGKDGAAEKVPAISSLA